MHTLQHNVSVPWMVSHVNIVFVIILCLIREIIAALLIIAWYLIELLNAYAHYRIHSQYKYGYAFIIVAIYAMQEYLNYLILLPFYGSVTGHANINYNNNSSRSASHVINPTT